MSQSISTLLIRNLDDVFGEGDPQRRRAAIDEIFTEDAVFYEPGAVHRGRDEIDRIAGVIRATHPTFPTPRPPRRRSCIMRAASTGYPAHRKVHPPMPAPISSSSARAKSPRSISSSTPQPLELGGSAGALPPLPHSKLQTQGADGTTHAGLTTSSVRRSRKRGLCRNRAVGRPAVLNCSSSH